MALFLFTRAMLAGEPIQVFNHGRMVRDFAYIDDIVESLMRVLDRPAEPDPVFDMAEPDPASSWAPHRVFNIGNSNPTPLLDCIEAIEAALGVQAEKQWLSMQPDDVPATAADTPALEAWTGFTPNTPVWGGAPVSLPGIGVPRGVNPRRRVPLLSSVALGAWPQPLTFGARPAFPAEF